jgi:amino acid transporter
VEAGIWNMAASGPLAIGMAYSLWYWLGYYPQVDLLLAYVVALTFTFFFCGASVFLSSTMPRSGGDYVFIGRSIHPSLGFLSSWNMFIYSTITGQGSFAGYLAFYAFGPMLYVLGSMLGNPSLIQMGEASLTFPWNFAIVVVLIVGVGVILLLGLKTSVRIAAVLVILAWVCLLFG